jgi:hypothetical protein
MDITVEIADLRNEAESMMTDQCIVTRVGVASGAPVLDPATGKYPVIPPVPVYTGMSSIKIPGTVSTGKFRPTAGDVATLLSAIFSIPWFGPRLETEDIILITASMMNPGLAGMEFHVTGLLPGSHITKQRVSVQAVID